MKGHARKSHAQNEKFAYYIFTENISSHFEGRVIP